MTSPTHAHAPRAAASPTPPSVAIVGGGLAGLAAASALLERGCAVTLYEARRQTAGRAASFADPANGQLIDHCQHVSLACCTNLAHLCRRAGLEHEFRRDRRLYFFSSDGRRADFTAAPLPAPLHLAPALARFGWLSWRDRWQIARAMSALLHTPHAPAGHSMGDWLRAHGQSPSAIDGFWSLVLVSALGETVDRAAYRYARQVFVDGFLANRRGYELLIPRRSLADLFGRQLTDWLVAGGLKLRLSTPVRQLALLPSSRWSLALADDHSTFDAVVLAVPWRRAAELFPGELLVQLPQVAAARSLAAAPISGVHLWFDRQLTELPHAVLVGRLTQWLFRREDLAGAAATPEHYYQAVISASRSLAGRSQADVMAEVHADLAAVFPAARAAKLLRGRLVTEPEAVFSVGPEIDDVRPLAATPLPGLALAGDWTATGWPATMEGAVRSGYLAASALLTQRGLSAYPLAPDLPRAPLARLLIRD